MMGWVSVSLMFFGGGVLAFISRWSHVLSVLLSLEVIMLGIYLCVVVDFVVWGGMGWVSLLFLGVVVCESGVGLGILVVMVRSYGGDCLMGFSGDVSGIS